tara:strand:+ start:40 stop:300 length:261 start_codon:yes stop_codon:yes gene_type:complete
MKNFLIKIRAYGYMTEFTVMAKDEAKSLEDAIVDKIGENGILWEDSRFYSLSRTWLTFEEIKDEPLTRPLQTEEVIGVKMGAGTSI